MRSWTLSVALLLINIALAGAADHATAPQPGSRFDAASFGIVEADQKSYGVRWGEPRKIRYVEVEFEPGATLPAPDKVRVQYWQSIWNGRPDPILAEAGAGQVGWAAVDDWTNGKWKDADAKVDVDGSRWTFRFEPTGAKEFPKLGQEGVRFRKTLKIRLTSPEDLPRPQRFSVITDAVYRPLSVRILWGSPAAANVNLDGDDVGRLEAYNGSVLSVKAMEGVTVDDHGQWMQKAGSAAGIEANLLMAVDPADPRYDRTVVTVRSKLRPLSFAADEIARGDRILVDDLGVLVVRGDDAISLDGYRQIRKEFPGKTIYQRVFNEPEQSLGRAWNDMPIKRPLWFVHGLPGDRNVMRQGPNGDLEISARRWFNVQPSPRDTKRHGWKGDTIKYAFGLPPDAVRGGRELRNGHVPQIRTWWQDGGIFYEQTNVLDTLNGDLSDVHLDDPAVLLMRIRVVNTSIDQPQAAHLLFTSVPGGGPEKLVLEGDRMMAGDTTRSAFRYLFRKADRGETSQADNGVKWNLTLAPGESQNLYFFIPTITLDKDEEIEALRKRDFNADSNRIAKFWADAVGRGTQIDTPEPWLNGFYKAHLQHMLVNCVKELKSDRLHAHVGTLSYGVYPDESGMMISDLDRRGYHKEAAQCLKSFLDYQGTVQMPGNFKTKEGLFYGSGGHDTGGYNKSHGWVMWLMAEHWKFTHDKEWMEAAAPKLIASCDWVTRERKATMTTNEDDRTAGINSRTPIEYGFLPTGSLEDVTDYWHWLVTNACTVWGFSALADALADFGHPEAKRLQADAEAFRKDVMAGLTESRILAPVVKLRDGTYVPKYPSRLYERGRCHGWLRETLEGSIHLMITGLLPPDAPEAKWIIQDFEDNLYISADYGYAIPSFDSFWFSRGGFSMQANLLGGPLVYLARDEVKHFLRGYFNSFASAFYPDIKMCNEHSMPELGYPAGDHYKTSDEAQSSYWLRLMFVREQGNDLYLGQAIPREWLRSAGMNSRGVGIDRAASYFGPLSFRITQQPDNTIKAVVTPPQRNRPVNIYVRLCHPQSKPIQSVTVNGKPYDRFDAKKEWVVLPGTVEGVQEIVAHYSD